jgi:hypothetical protein
MELLTTKTAYVGESQLEKEALAAISLDRPPFWRHFRSETILVLVFLALSILVIGLNLSPGEPKRLLQALATASALAVFGLAYLQWRAARHELSFDKYYDKLDIANRRFDSWRLEVLKGNPENLQDHLNTMFVFAELDNLEYVLEKYKLGYVRQVLVHRALRTFRSRSADFDFRKRSLYWVGEQEGDEVEKGYHKTTRVAVRYIVSRIQ